MAEDVVERPTCKCHGAPMVRNSRQSNGNQKWACAAKRRKNTRSEYLRGGRARRLAQYEQRKAEGGCVRCGEPRLSEALCWDCLNYMEHAHALRI